MILIHSAKPTDAKRLLDIYSYYVENTAITFEYEVPSIPEFEDRIRHTKEKFPYFVAEENNVILGYCYASPFHERAAYGWSAEISIYIDKDARRGGIGRRLYHTMEHALYAMGITNVYACIAYIDEEDEHLDHGSPQFHDRMGYKIVGKFDHCAYKFNKWYSMIWMEKIIGSHDEKPRSVLPYPEYLKLSAAAQKK